MKTILEIKLILIIFTSLISVIIISLIMGFASIAVLISIPTSIFTFIAVLYLFEISWKKEIREKQMQKENLIKHENYGKLNLRVLGQVEARLDKLTKSTFWIFLLIFINFYLSSMLIIRIIKENDYLLSWTFSGIFLTIMILSFYYYYKTKHENDLLKESIQVLKKSNREY